MGGEGVRFRPVQSEGADRGSGQEDSLNNRALSCLDLGQEEDAEACWAQAAEMDRASLWLAYNQELWQWRKGRIGYEELLRRMYAADKSGREDSFSQMMAQISLEGREAPMMPRACPERAASHFRAGKL